MQFERNSNNCEKKIRKCNLLKDLFSLLLNKCINVLSFNKNFNIKDKSNLTLEIWEKFT